MTSPQHVRDHLVAHLGPVTATDTAGRVPLLIFSNDPGMSTVVTDGLRSADVAVLMPQELVCSVQPDQLGAAVALVRDTSDLVLDSGRGVIDDDVIGADRPLLAGTQISGVLTGSHPYLDDAINFVVGEDGQPVVNLVTLLPVTSSEVAFFRRESVEDLYELLEREQPNLLDVTRGPCV